jgi:hypothetical protein
MRNQRRSQLHAWSVVPLDEIRTVILEKDKKIARDAQGGYSLL